MSPGSPTLGSGEADWYQDRSVASGKLGPLLQPELFTFTPSALRPSIGAETASASPQLSTLSIPDFQTSAMLGPGGYRSGSDLGITWRVRSDSSRPIPPYPPEMLDTIADQSWGEFWSELAQPGFFHGWAEDGDRSVAPGACAFASPETRTDGSGGMLPSPDPHNPLSPEAATQHDEET
ncbi:hypothetical protein OQA88_1493 [Cercophora sp. LCS_1]